MGVRDVSSFCCPGSVIATSCGSNARWKRIASPPSTTILGAGAGPSHDGSIMSAQSPLPCSVQQYVPKPSQRDPRFVSTQASGGPTAPVVGGCVFGARPPVDVAVGPPPPAEPQPAATTVAATATRSALVTSLLRRRALRRHRAAAGSARARRRG